MSFSDFLQKAVSSVFVFYSNSDGMRGIHLGNEDLMKIQVAVQKVEWSNIS